MRLRRNEVLWQLPDEELVALFVGSALTQLSAGRRGPSLPAALGRFLAAKAKDGGLQSVPLLDTGDDLSSFDHVFAAIVSAQPDRADTSARPVKSVKAAARLVATTAANERCRQLELASRIRILVDAAPPLSEEQKVRLRALFAVAPDHVPLNRQAKQELLSRMVRKGTFRMVGGSGGVRLWWDSLAEFGWQLSEDEMAARFLSSRFADRERWPWPVDQVLDYFVHAHEHEGGLQSAWLHDATSADRKAHQRVNGLIMSMI